MNGIRVAKRFVDQGVLNSLNAALQQLDARVAGVDSEGGNGWSRAFDKKASGMKSQDKSSKGSLGGENGRE
jgi:hypothetical protein